ncbi:uncharacterized protein K452DRAFT_338138 [Aplosporella prunicola CBS 121167]|uniref:Uncharacterized protein n=1 Tax=Aplosporella prunicola CBS 121167 TaxID=1176127 RepID=A0A6A6B5V3_9PEZI|nr:uncharacterized protein K452DRAFT_338138 [Aplosporella prunicola CBS 121167]KAF2138665.1 hypothetical protein K452DRAFT_338138 [Aplosporella prunicola CBS 121167]
MAPPKLEPRARKRRSPRDPEVQLYSVRKHERNSFWDRERAPKPNSNSSRTPKPSSNSSRISLFDSIGESYMRNARETIKEAASETRGGTQGSGSSRHSSSRYSGSSRVSAGIPLRPAQRAEPCHHDHHSDDYADPQPYSHYPHSPIYHIRGKYNFIAHPDSVPSYMIGSGQPADLLRRVRMTDSYDAEVSGGDGYGYAGRESGRDSHRRDSHSRVSRGRDSSVKDSYDIGPYHVEKSHRSGRASSTTYDGAANSHGTKTEPRKGKLQKQKREGSAAGSKIDEEIVEGEGMGADRPLVTRGRTWLDRGGRRGKQQQQQEPVAEKKDETKDEKAGSVQKEPEQSAQTAWPLGGQDEMKNEEKKDEEKKDDDKNDEAKKDEDKNDGWKQDDDKKYDDKKADDSWNQDETSKDDKSQDLIPLW